MDPELAAWLAARAVPLEPDEVGEPAFRALAPVWGGAQVIGLGHTVSGTHDLATLAQRLFAHLVDEYGVTTLAIDASASSTAILDDHVRGGGGDPLDVLDRLGRLSWRTREGLAVAEALRAHNGERPPEQHVHVVGLDPSLPANSILVVGRVLRASAPDAFEALAPDMAGLVAELSVERLQAAVAAAAAALEDPAVVDATEASALAEARHHVHLLRRAAEYATAGDDAPAVRQRLMAEAVTEAVADAATRAGEKDGDKTDEGDGVTAPGGPAVVLWAHADHVLVGDDPVPTLGRHLRTALGDDYYAIGLLGGCGAFRAARRRKRRGPSRSLSLHRFSPVPGLAADLVAAIDGNHVVDLRSDRAAAPPPVARWCDTPAPTRILGEEIAGRADKTPPRSVVPGQAADGWATISMVRPAAPR